MKRTGVGLLAGLVFGAGLELSGMTNPAKVLNFLDLFGARDLSLAFVMGTALLVSSLGVWAARRRTHSWLGDPFAWPTRSSVDRSLLAGSVSFGVGWGLAGFCPGPALANLHRADTDVLVFVGAMLAGMLLHHVAFERGRSLG